MQQSKSGNLYQTENGPCPYLPAGQWTTDVICAGRMSESSYETLLEQGWRRSGCCFYRNTCPNCQSCLPIRVDVSAFKPSRSQKRTLKNNRDISVERIPAVFNAQDYALYSAYCRVRHQQNPTEEDYYRFLIESPLRTEIMRYRFGEHLLAVAWIDLLPGAVSSVYCAYDPTCAHRSPGTLSILRQIELCREMRKSWLYLGFYVPGSPQMHYKINFQPCQIRHDQLWQQPSCIHT
jgi:leucyl-tRNA---protein transferase